MDAFNLNADKVRKVMEEIGWMGIFWKNVRICIQKRSVPDRGEYVLQIYSIGPVPISVDQQAGFPRYFFDLNNLIAELRAWLEKREASCAQG
ncbi:MAG: hypothetical protein HOO67_06320 [Candidatus Peribacteraceae bacterium]|nr:hypothetical protein [Candidatus Peribacteraceae bacterium]